MSILTRIIIIESQKMRGKETSHFFAAKEAISTQFRVLKRMVSVDFSE
jgi:hypothetical protein